MTPLRVHVRRKDEERQDRGSRATMNHHEAKRLPPARSSGSILFVDPGQGHSGFRECRLASVVNAGRDRCVWLRLTWEMRRLAMGSKIVGAGLLLALLLRQAPAPRMAIWRRPRSCTTNSARSATATSRNLQRATCADPVALAARARGNPANDRSNDGGRPDDTTLERGNRNRSFSAESVRPGLSVSRLCRFMDRNCGG